jgi:hypothetical protein
MSELDETHDPSRRSWLEGGCSQVVLETHPVHAGLAARVGIKDAIFR